jgi:hypothetical protein
LTSTDADITFSSIPATYRDLILVIEGTGTANFNPVFDINADGTTANYSIVFMLGAGSGSGTSGTATTRGWGVMLNSANGRSSNIYQFMDYSATDKHKTTLIRTSQGNGGDVIAYATRWANTAAINSLRITTGGAAVYNIGTTFNLYGIN